MTLRVFESTEALAYACATFIAKHAKAAITQRGEFNIALSGGSTPAATYKKLAQEPLSNQIPWAQVHVFWSDERCVPPEDPESNYGIAYATLLKHVAIPSENIHRLHGELPPAEASDQANGELAAHFGRDVAPIFDLILLGLGEDGHTASLFPGSEALKKTDGLVAANYIAKLHAWRLTSTYPLINAARQILFLVSGDKKAEVVKRTVEDHDPRLPASIVQPGSGSVTWYLDQPAAGCLSRQTLGN
ncbi:MAG: 6-phosphogluconolactonase [Anaerolineales bacterium]